MFLKIASLLLKSKNYFAQNSKRLLSASLLNEKIVCVQDADHSKPPMKFHTIWLRDNCQCSECFHFNTKSRKINWERTMVPQKITPSTVEIENKTLTIQWQDRHRSVFDLNWLKDRDFSLAQRQKYLNEIYKPPAQLWGKENFKNVMQTFNYNDVIKSDKVLLAWLEVLAKTGLAIIKNAPHDETVARQLAERIGFLKRTTYGELFEVKSIENAQNYAFLMTPLPLHTDLPYFEYKSGINILHCYVQSQSKGGSNLITDGFYIADKMRQEYVEYYETLLRTPVNWSDIGKDPLSFKEFYSIWRSPVISLDIDGNYHRIDHSMTTRDSHFTVPLEKVEPWYEAYDKFLEFAYAEAVEIKTEPGDVLVFNNLRVLHGRTAYEDSAGNKRHLIGAYVDWDLIYSKIRILKMKHLL